MARKKPQGETLDQDDEEADLFRRAKSEKDLPAWRLLVEESMEASAGPYRLSNDAIERGRIRFDAAQELIKKGNREAARRLAWWPQDEDPPKTHWSRVPLQKCSCRHYAPEGHIALCGYCGGATDETPTALPIHQIPSS